MKQTLADLAIRLGLPQVVRVEKGGEGVRERKSFSQQQLFIADRTYLEPPPLAAPEMMHSSVCLLQNRRSAGDFYRILTANLNLDFFKIAQIVSLEKLCSLLNMESYLINV